MDAYVNIRKMGKNILLAICDSEMLGKTLRQGKISFHMIENSTIVNIVGKNCVKRAIAKGYVHPDAVLQIEGVPHAQIVKL